jgi:hypothetical protein
MVKNAKPLTDEEERALRAWCDGDIENGAIVDTGDAIRMIERLLATLDAERARRG